MFFEIGVLKNFAKFTGKHLCQSLFFNKVTGLRPASLLKKRLWHGCFPVKFGKYLFLQNTSGGCFCSCYLFQNFWKLELMKTTLSCNFALVSKANCDHSQCSWTDFLLDTLIFTLDTLDLIYDTLDTLLHVFHLPQAANTAQKIKFSIKDFFSKCDQICCFLRIWLHLLNKSLMEISFFFVQ